MNAIDPEDYVFVALALSINNDGIWSEDKHLEKQKVIRVWKTKDLLEHLFRTTASSKLVRSKEF